MIFGQRSGQERRKWYDASKCLCVPHWSKKHSLFYLSSFADCEFSFINHLYIFVMFIFSTMLLTMIMVKNSWVSLLGCMNISNLVEAQREKKLISASCWVDKWSIFSTPEKIYLSQQHLRFLLHWKKNSWLENHGNSFNIQHMCGLNYLQLQIFSGFV